MTTSTLSLGNRFATEFPELAISWQAQHPPQPTLLLLNEPLARELGLDPDWLRSPAGIGLLTGTTLPASATPVAQVYAGHQFGGLQPRLGDGRALLLGEFEDGRDLHLKGSGRTPLARGGDGLAAIGPMVREYVISEAMHALGIPTTRSLAVVATGATVHRETPLPGAVLARVAASHLRVGSFQYAAGTGDNALLRRLADHAIARHHPGCAQADNPYLALFDAVISVQAELVARWMLVGFIHGVMNTDNVTISGETIDYGPCAFMDTFDPATVFSSIDSWGRYAYGNQPAITGWNLARFAETLLPLIDEDADTAIELATATLGEFAPRYQAAWRAGMRTKLGLAQGFTDDALIDELPALMAEHRTDHTSFFRGLAHGDMPLGFMAWVKRWRTHSPDTAAMDAANPVYIPRNHLVEEALAAATAGDVGPARALLDAVGDPFTERPGLQRYALPASEDFAAGYRTFCGT
ncbi:YdiU family protein [Mycobacterium sp. ITM-2016-00316]|uniref:protein adenylyltransferase SelO n=1 Tax=Mycobacterium sp. ITM-2016-00316 TaxID=2099695 RepID=UPI000CF9AF4C|nr:YdiU family protein [Mycobacterium sp. ITM-2016-00316]WNG80075.1 YdiU family protein [Mycobacterium sp. ITM-2016-00316]